ncbi:MAG: hypothetical protein ACO3JL_19740 [Myxococcota bacterium]
MRAIVVALLGLCACTHGEDAALPATCGLREHTGEVVPVTVDSEDALAATATCSSVPGDLVIEGTAFVSLVGLEGLRSVGGDLYLTDNESLRSLEGLAGLERVEGNVYVYRNLALKDFAGLDALRDIGGKLGVWKNGNLESFHGLEHLEVVEGELSIWYNDVLVGLTGLDGARSAGSVHIERNASLASLTGLMNLTNVEGDVAILRNLSLPLCEAERLAERAGRTCGVDADCEDNRGTGVCE